MIGEKFVNQLCFQLSTFEWEWNYKFDEFFWLGLLVLCCCCIGPFIRQGNENFHCWLCLLMVNCVFLLCFNLPLCGLGWVDLSFFMFLLIHLQCNKWTAACHPWRIGKGGNKPWKQQFKWRKLVRFYSYYNMHSDDTSLLLIYRY